MRENTKVMWFGLHVWDKAIDSYIVTVSNIIDVYCTIKPNRIYLATTCTRIRT